MTFRRFLSATTYRAIGVALAALVVAAVASEAERALGERG